MGASTENRGVVAAVLGLLGGVAVVAPFVVRPFETWGIFVVPLGGLLVVAALVLAAGGPGTDDRVYQRGQ